MSKFKKNLYEFDKTSEEPLFYHGEYLENSIIFNFLNYEFDKQKSTPQILRDFANIFKYDVLISSELIINEENIEKLHDYYANVGEQVTYFQAIQTELKPVLKEIIQNIVSPLRKKVQKIPIGPYSSIEKHLKNLGELEYCSTNGNLVLIWKYKPTSFLQLILRSLIAVTKYDRSILKYVIFCKQCQKIFINNDGRRIFCSRPCSTKHYDNTRNHEERYAKEISNPNYARCKKIDGKI